MSKHDLYHEDVREALIKDGWTITHDPLTIPGLGDSDYHIDLGAERLIGAEKAGEKIAVEIKSFVGKSFVSAFHNALGQFNNYQVALERKEPDRALYMAVPETFYINYFNNYHMKRVMERFDLKIIAFNVDNQNIVEWKK